MNAIGRESDNGLYLLLSVYIRRIVWYWGAGLAVFKPER